MSAPYLFPTTAGRRIPGVLYLLIGAGCIALAVAAGDDGVLVNRGVLISRHRAHRRRPVPLPGAGGTWRSTRNRRSRRRRASSASPSAASAQLGWRGLRSRPTWRILLYSNEPSPEQRGLVLVDGIDGEIIDSFTERNPEDWTGLDQS
ncbi:MAG: hypothetical protein R2695_09170 [Acidimicrobiales bacterium]